MADIKKIRLSGVTYNIVDEGALRTLDNTVTSGGTNAVKGSGIYDAITASSAAVLETVGQAGYQTSGDVQNAISGKLNTSDAISGVSISTDATNNRITLSLTKGNGQISTTYPLKGGTGIKIKDDDHSINVDTTVIAQKTDIPSVSGYADAVEYDSNAKEVKFYHGGTGGTEVYSFDASPFLIDGMVESVVITSVTSGASEIQVLEITWNSAAGGQVTDIPLTDIFDASNYYTTAQTNSAIEAAVSGKTDESAFTAYTSATDTVLSGKQDTLTAGTGIDITSNVISVTGVPLTMEDNVTSGSSNPVKSSGIYSFVTGETATKQDTLVSGTNIKTVGNTTVLGSGNIALMTASIGTGNDSETLIFDFA